MPYRMRGKANLSDDECDLRDMQKCRSQLEADAQRWRERATPRVGPPIQSFIEHAQRIETVHLPTMDARITEMAEKVAERKGMKNG